MHGARAALHRESATMVGVFAVLQHTQDIHANANVMAFVVGAL